MTLATYADAAWSHFDGTETVTLRHTNTAGTTSNTAGVTGLGFKIDKLPDGTLVSDHKLWVLRTSTLGANTPIRGDQIITSDSETWIINELSHQAHNTKWNCICAKGR